MKESITVTIQRAEILIFTEAVVMGLKMNNTVCVNLKQQEGFAEVEQMVHEGKVSVSGFKIIILLFGRADMLLEEKIYLNALHKCLATLHRCNKDALLILTATLPVPGDSRITINTANQRSGIMARTASMGAQVEFSKPGKRLIHKLGGAIREFFSEGMVNDGGLDQIVKGLEGKIACAHLMQKFHDLQGRVLL